MIAKPILYFRHELVLVCDARCDKAWGINSRTRVQLSATDEDDYAFLSDGGEYWCQFIFRVSNGRKMN